MPGTNDSFTFGSSCYSIHDFGELPKGICFSLGMNPYNGLVLARYNASPVGIEVVDILLAQLQAQRDFLSDALERQADLGDIAEYCKGNLVIKDFEPFPFCGCVPHYEEGAFSGEIVCCGGRLRFDGFESRSQAVKAWNDRSAFKVSKVA